MVSNVAREERSIMDTFWSAGKLKLLGFRDKQKNLSQGTLGMREYMKVFQLPDSEIEALEVDKNCVCQPLSWSTFTLMVVMTLTYKLYSRSSICTSFSVCSSSGYCVQKEGKCANKSGHERRHSQQHFAAADQSAPCPCCLQPHIYAAPINPWSAIHLRDWQAKELLAAAVVLPLALADLKHLLELAQPIGGLHRICTVKQHTRAQSSTMQRHRAQIHAAICAAGGLHFTELFLRIKA
eukprot:1158208-Pelagomonas_calceolata.AAC.36